MSEARRKMENAARLLLIDVTIRSKVASVLATLEHYGHSPVIGREVWRDPALQLSMFRRKVSRVKWGFHCATRNGKPASLAADIVDFEKGWNASAEFWVILGYAAKAQGLGWGGYWGLDAAGRKKIDAAVEKAKLGKKTGLRLPGQKNSDFGWDVAHVETKRVTVAQAKRGER